MKRAQYITIKFLVIFFSVVLGVLFFVQCEVDADMAGSITERYVMNQFLGENFEWLNISSYNPWNVVSWIVYNILGISEDSVKMITTIFYILCVAIAFELCIDKHTFSEIPLLLVLFFVLIPGVSVNKYHYASTIVILLTLLYIKKRNNIKNNKIYFDVIAAILFFMLLFLTADKLLIILNVCCPIVIYIFYNMLKNKRYHSILLAMLAVVTIGLLLISLLSQGNELTLYGASDYYLSWADLADVWNSGIEFLIKTVTRAMNINTSGTIVQPMSFVWILKIILLVLAIIELITCIKDVFGGKKDNFYNVILSGAIVLSVVFYLINGRRIELYEEYGYSYSYCGYMGCVWFLLPLLAIERIKKIISKYEMLVKKKDLCLFTISLCVMCAMGVLPTLDIFMSDYSNINKQVADYLQERDYEGGIAVYNASHTVTMWSEGKFYSIPYVKFDEESELGYRKIDTYIEWKSNDIGQPENIEADLDNLAMKKYGQWDERVKFSEDLSRTSESDYPQERILYLYKRDIRWPQRVFDAKEVINGSKNILLPFGENRVCLSGSNMDGIELGFEYEEGQEIDFIVEYATDTQISYLLDINKNSNVFIKTKKEVLDADLATVVLDVNRAALNIGNNIEVCKDTDISITSEVPKGDYMVIITGDDLGDINMSVRDEQGVVEAYQDGNGRKIFKCSTYVDDASLYFVTKNETPIVVGEVYIELPNQNKAALIEQLNND